MKNLIYPLMLFILELSYFQDGTAQISTYSTPAGFNQANSLKSIKNIPQKLLDSVNVDFQKSLDQKNGIPNRIGIVQNMNINIREEGIKSTLGHINIWRFKINCPDAKALGLFFNNYLLPPGGELYVYTSDTTHILGAYTNINNKNYRQLSIGSIDGNDIIIEYNEPITPQFEGEIVLESVFTAYRSLAEAGSTFIDINCDEGNDWQDLKRSVCLMSFAEENSWYVCTGALINNVRQDETPFFLSANHCISSQGVAQTLVTYFNYENSTCNGNDASLDQSISGATLMATSSYNDFTLLKLSTPPPTDYQPYYAGWNANDELTTGSTTCIHHPGGNPKSIAIDRDEPVNYPYSIRWDDNLVTSPDTHWQVEYDEGADASGSSGSPLFDDDKRIIGQLHGGDDEISLFGKFSVSWDYYSTPSSQLKYWLDPDDTGITVLDGINYNRQPNADFESDVSLACLNTAINLSDLSKGQPTQWYWTVEPETFQFVNGTDPNTQNPQVLFTKEGSYSITLIVANNYGSDTITYENLIEAKSVFPVAFSNMTDEISLCGKSMDQYELEAQGAENYSFTISEENFFDYDINDNLLTLTINDKARQNGSFDVTVTTTGGHGSCLFSDSVLIHVSFPVNDNIENAINLKLGNNGTFTLNCGTIEPNEPAPPSGECSSTTLCSTSEAQEDDISTWFSFKAPSNGKITINGQGSGAQFAVYQADTYSDIISGKDSFSLIAATGYSSSPTLKNLNVNRFNTYWLQVFSDQSDVETMEITLLSNTIEVYPNPSDGIFHLTISGVSEEESATIKVFTQNGRQLLAQNITISPQNTSFDLNLTGYPSGTYLIYVQTSQGELVRKVMLRP
ncbi:T9SS type A sorting domain-containing protein [Thermophagus sp. OGC60D27]|uniref:T9SS type A sorting domain-containing protein n=1 Tax=Thermophagus sp. OGC60D27 TaxID=3458415 RepID=UPI004037F634